MKFLRVLVFLFAFTFGLRNKLKARNAKLQATNLALRKALKAMNGATGKTEKEVADELYYTWSFQNQEKEVAGESRSYGHQVNQGMAGSPVDLPDDFQEKEVADELYYTWSFQNQEAAVSEGRANSDPNVYCKTGYHAVDVPFSWTGGFACGQNCVGGTLTDYHCNCLCVSKANKEAEVGRWEERHDEKYVGGIDWGAYGKRMRECPEYNQAACGAKSYCYWSDFLESCRYDGVGHAVEAKIGNEAYVACSPSYCNNIEQGNCPSSCPKTYWDEISGREWCDC